jgi:hypothetical protein
MVAVPSPRTWTDGETPTATMLNTELRDAYAFFANRPRVKVYRSTAQTITTSGGVSNDQVLTWTHSIYDSDGMFNAARTGGSSDSRLTAVTAGSYLIMLHVNWDPINDASPGSRYAAVKLNANGDNDIDTNLNTQIGNDITRLTNSDTTLPQTNHISLQYYLGAGDYVEAMIGTSYNSQNTLVTGAEQRTWFGMRWIGAG